MYLWFPGNLVDWWYPATKDKYMQKAQCIIQQYGNYTIDELGVSLNGINTQGENIADNGGLQTAYYAYKAWLKKQDFDQEQPLPGLKHSHDQLFFLSFAQVHLNHG